MALSLLLDNADPSIWAKWLKLGVFNGITTNPSLLKEASQPCTLLNLKKLAQKAKSIECKELHIQAWGSSAKDIENFAMGIAELSTPEMQIHVKIPTNKEGSEVAKKLIAKDISITFTACHEIKQILIASAMRATYIAPYLGRINDQGKNGLEELVSMQKIIEKTNSSCKLLVASIRNISDIIHLASNGIDTFTINNEIAEEIYNCEATIRALEQFEKDAK